MHWQDIGGYTRAQHIVVSSSYGEYYRLLCGNQITFAFHVKRRRPLPRCRACREAFAELVIKLG